MRKNRQQELEKRAREIAAAWYIAIANTASTALDPEEVKIRLEKLATQALLLVQDDSFSFNNARLIGAELVNLHYDQPDSLNISVRVLKEQLIDSQSSKNKLPPNIPGLFEGITNGFVEQLQKANLLENEYFQQTNGSSEENITVFSQDQPESQQTASASIKNSFGSKENIAETFRNNEDQFRVLFDESPLPLTLFDASQLFFYQEKLRQLGLIDFVAYIEENPDEIYKCSKFIRVIAINQAAISFLKASNKELIYQNHTMLLPLGGDQLMKEIMIDMFRGIKSNNGEFSGYSLSGTRSAALYNWSVIANHEQDYSRIILSLADITAQKRAADAINLNAQRLQALVEIESRILAADSLNGIVDIALKLLPQIISCYSGSISLFDFDKSQIMVLSSMNDAIPSGTTFPMASVERLKNNLKNTFIINREDFHAYEKDYPILKGKLDTMVKSLLLVPLFFHESLIGSLNLASTEFHAFADEDISFANKIAGLITIAIFNSNLLKAEKRARQEAETLQEVASILNASLTAEDLLNLILIQLERVIPYDSCSIVMINDNRLIFSAQRGLELDIQIYISRFDSLPANIDRLIKNKEPMIIADTHLDPEWIFFPKGEYIRCWLGIPLMVRGNLLGLLMLNKTEPNFYTKLDLNLALAFANQAATALENARLVRETQQYLEQTEQQVVARTRDLSTLYEITALSSQQLDLAAKIERALTITLQALRCDIGVIQIVDTAANKLKAIAWRGLEPDLVNFVQDMPMDLRFVSEVIQGRKPIIVANVYDDSRAADLPLRPLNANHTIAAPMRVKGQVLGIVSISSTQDEPFNREDVALLCSVADQIGAAIEEDRLRKQDEMLVLIQERERLARDLHDSVTQSLFSLSLFAAGARDLLQLGEVEKALKYLDDIDQTANQIHKELRLMLYELRPDVLKNEGLVGAIHQRLETVEDRSGINRKVQLNISEPIPPEIEEALFRVMLEALNNILKHAGASDVRINLKAENGRVEMEIIDDGCGFSEDSIDVRRGMGITSMTQRVKGVKGSMEIVSTPGQGTKVSVKIPIPAEDNVPEKDYVGFD